MRNRNVSGIPNLLISRWKMCALAHLRVPNGTYVRIILSREEIGLPEVFEPVKIGSAVLKGLHTGCMRADRAAKWLDLRVR